MDKQFTITLPDDLADMVKAKVASGEYASVDEVIGAALAQSEDAPVHSGEEFERWLRTEVVDRCRRMEENPSSGRTPDEVKVSLQREYDRLIQSRA